MTEGTFRLELTAAEAALLDGKVGPTAQAVVDQARTSLKLMQSGIRPEYAKMVAEIANLARTKGKLICRPTSARHCPCCNRTEGYYLVKRSSRYKRKGEPDRDKPIHFTVWDVEDSFVKFRNTVFYGFCALCRDEMEPMIRAAVQDIPCEIVGHWPGMPGKFKRHNNKKCVQCGWTGSENQMRDVQSSMGGKYKGGCPKCGAENRPFGETLVKCAAGFTLVRIEG